MHDSLNANLKEHCFILNLKFYKYLYPIRSKDRVQIFYHLEGIDDFSKKNIFTDTNLILLGKGIMIYNIKMDIWM